MWSLVLVACVPIAHGNTSPDLAFTVEISLELIPPEAFRSNLKFVPSVVCPDRAFTALISLELTERLPFTSPTRKPTAAETSRPTPFTGTFQIVDQTSPNDLRSPVCILGLEVFEPGFDRHFAFSGVFAAFGSIGSRPSATRATFG